MLLLGLKLVYITVCSRLGLPALKTISTQLNASHDSFELSCIDITWKDQFKSLTISPSGISVDPLLLSCFQFKVVGERGILMVSSMMSMSWMYRLSVGCLKVNCSLECSFDPDCALDSMTGSFSPKYIDCSLLLMIYAVLNVIDFAFTILNGTSSVTTLHRWVSVLTCL